MATELYAENKCCSLESVSDARRVAAQLDIPFYVVNVEEPFRETIVDYFYDEYAAGRTPNPCLRCNRHDPLHAAAGARAGARRGLSRHGPLRARGR